MTAGATVDVRDMLCAQALAVVAKAARRLAVGQSLTILYNAEDVARDLAAWVRDRRYPIVEQREASLTFHT